MQEEAQAVYDADPSDPHGLDGSIGPQNDDGRACEELPSRADASTTTSLTGSVSDDPAIPRNQGALPKTGSTSVPLAVPGSKLLAMGRGSYSSAVGGPEE